MGLMPEQPAGTRGLREAAGGAVVILLPALLFCLPLLAGGVPYLADAGQIFYPLMDHLARSLRTGAPGLWNPDLAGGYFAHGAGQSSMMYPLNWGLYRFVPMPWAFSASYVIHLSLAALGFWWFLRLLGLLPASAVLGALLYAFNGHVAGHHIHLNVLLTLAWLPWALGALHLALERASARRISVFGLAYGMMALAGHPQWLWLGTVALAIYALVGVGAGERGGGRGRASRLGRRVLALAPGLLLGGLIGAAQLLPTAQEGRASDRAGTDAVAYATSYSLGLEDVPRLLCPNVHGNPARGGAVVEGSHWWETAGFQGAAALCLAALFFAGFRFGPAGWYALVLIALGLFLAFAEGNPAYRALAHVPLMGDFRAPARYLLLALIGIAIAAAHGHSALARGEALRRPAVAQWAMLGAPAVLVLMIVLGNATFAGFRWAVVSPLNPDALRVPEETRADVIHNYFVGWEPLLIALAAVLAGLWMGVERLRRVRGMVALPVLLVAGELLMFWRSFVVTTTPEYYTAPPPYLAAARREAPEGWGRLLVAAPPTADAYTEGVRAHFLEFLGPVWGFSVLEGQDSLQPWEAVTKRHRIAAALHSPLPLSHARARRLCDLYGVRWVVSEEDLTPVGLQPDADPPSLWRNPTALPAAYVATSVVPAATLKEQEAAVEREGFRPGVDCALDPAIADGQAEAHAPRAEILEHRPGRLVVRVTSPRPAMLVYQQNPHPDWRATIDGRPAPAVRANAINIAVPLEGSARAQEVRLEFRSGATRLGVALSVIGAALALILLMAARRPRGRGAPSAGAGSGPCCPPG